MRRTGLLTGSLPFAGLPDSPSTEVLAHLHGRTFGAVTVHAEATRVSLADLPRFVPELIRAHRPAWVVSLGLSPGEAVVRLESHAINRLAFATPDNEGRRPTDGRPLDPEAPPARAATWDAEGLVAELIARGLPAMVSHFAGTHLCNATLFTALGALEREGLRAPCGFVHLPYLPTQVARFLAEAPESGALAPYTPRALPSMALTDQVRVVETVAAALSR